MPGAALFGLVLAGLPVAFRVTAIPIFPRLAQLRMLSTCPALILPFAAPVFGTFLFRQSFAGMPSELFAAARSDRLSEPAIVWRIAFPLSMPAVTAFARFWVTAHRNDPFRPQIAATDRVTRHPVFQGRGGRYCATGWFRRPRTKPSVERSARPWWPPGFFVI